jgi:hypothetical protein
VTGQNSFVDVSEVRSGARTGCVDFGYFARAVLGLDVFTGTAEVVQFAVEQKANAWLSSVAPKTLAAALVLWLRCSGVGVEYAVLLQPSEVLVWLFGEELKRSAEAVVEAVVDVTPWGVTLTWV